MKRRIELSIIIPLYNEEKRFLKSFKKITEFFNAKKIHHEYILVDDGSVDKTYKIISNLKIKGSLKILKHQKNQGKGAAIKTGVAAAEGTNVFFTDIDLSTPITEFDKLYKSLKSHHIVVGSRRLKDSEVAVTQPLHRRVLGNIFYIFYSHFFSSAVKDTNCGFKCYRGEIAKNLYSKVKNDRWGFDAEAIFLADKFGYKIKELPVVWLNDPNSRVSSFEAVLTTTKELFLIKLNYVLGRYKTSESFSKKAFQKVLQIFFKIFFGIFGQPKMDKNLKKAVELYEDTGFGKLFMQIRSWDAPFEAIEKVVPRKGTIIDLGCGDGLMAGGGR